MKTTIVNWRNQNRTFSIKTLHQNREEGNNLAITLNSVLRVILDCEEGEHSLDIRYPYHYHLSDACYPAVALDDRKYRFVSDTVILDQKTTASTNGFWLPKQLFVIDLFSKHYQTLLK